MADLIECPVCLDEFPILQQVECRHHICQKCYDDINGIDGFLCPMCRRVAKDRPKIYYDHHTRKYFKSLIQAGETPTDGQDLFYETETKNINLKVATDAKYFNKVSSYLSKELERGLEN